MAESPLISCIIPVFNGARFLDEAVSSVEAQTFNPIEILVVDDGSTDDTPKIIAAMGHRIRSIRQENAGPAAARNCGIMATDGALIAFLDVDDLWLPEKIERQCRLLEATPGAGMCTTQVEHIRMPDAEAEAEALTESLNAPTAFGWLNSALIRRDVFEKVGLLDASFRHLDAAEFYLRVQDAGVSVEVMEETLMQRRLHADNLSRKRGTEDAEERLRLVQMQMRRRRQQQQAG